LPGNGAPSAAQRLRVDAYAGARRRYGEELSEAVVERIERELAIIAPMGFAAYFLIVRDIVALSPRTCGRGSGAASLVAYCLGITNVCPLKHHLYFERFLNPGRTDPPDIDVDFAWDERDAVLETVLARHRGHAAMVANHVLFQPRMAVREVAKVYGLTEAEIGRVTQRLLQREGYRVALAADGLQALEIALQFAAQITLNEGAVVGDDVHDLRDLLGREVLRAGVGIDGGLGEDAFGDRGSDAVDVRQRGLDAFVGRDFHPE
jgi:DNA polymerase III alpha subunit